MPRPITYDPLVNVNTFVWSINTIDYLKDGEAVVEGVTNRVFKEPTYGLIDHVQFIYLRGNDEISRVDNLFTKLGVANTPTEETFGPPYNYLNGSLNFLEAFEALDAAIFGIASTQGAVAAKTDNIAARLGTGYGTSPNSPPFAGLVVTSTLITSNERTHTAVEKIGNQAAQTKADVTALTTIQGNLIDNLGTDIDQPQVPATNPAYGANPSGVVQDGDTVLQAVGALSDQGLDHDTKIEDIKDVVGRTGASDPPITYLAINSQDAFLIGQSQLSSPLTSPHHDALILLDNMIEGGLRQEEGSNDFNLSVAAAEFIDPLTEASKYYFESYNFLYAKHDPVNTTCQMLRRGRRAKATAPNQKWVSFTIDLSLLPNPATHVRLVPVYSSGVPDTDFEIWVNATDSLLTGSSVRIFAADFGTWKVLPAVGSNGRIFVNFPNINGQLFAIRAIFKGPFP